MRIYVEPRRHCIQDVSGRRFLVHPLRVYEKGAWHYLQDRLDCSDITSVELIKRCSLPWARWGRRLAIPEAVHGAIVAFMRGWHAKQDASFDCYAFACLVGDVPREHARIWEHWVPVERARRQPGDVVFLIRKNPKRFHAAVHLCGDLYLSVWGAGGDLEVATLADMQRDFDTDETFDMSPRP